MYRCFSPGMIGVDRQFPDAAALAADHDFEGIAVDPGYLQAVGPDEYRAVLDEHDLRPGVMGLPFRVDGDQSDYEAGLEDFDELAATAAEIGCERASTYIFPWSDERDFESNFAFHRDRIEPVAQTLADYGIRLGLEYIGPKTFREGHDYEFVHTAEGMLDLCAAIDADNVGLLLDSWHWYTAGEDAETLRALTNDDVVEVHVNDAPERPRDEQIDTERRLPATTGVIDIATFLSELDALDYDGPVSVEPFSDDVESMADADAVATTKAALDDAWEQAGL